MRNGTRQQQRHRQHRHSWRYEHSSARSINHNNSGSKQECKREKKEKKMRELFSYAHLADMWVRGKIHIIIFGTHNAQRAAQKWIFVLLLALKRCCNKTKGTAMCHQKRIERGMYAIWFGRFILWRNIHGAQIKTIRIKNPWKSLEINFMEKCNRNFFPQKIGSSLTHLIGEEKSGISK